MTADGPVPETLLAAQLAVLPDDPVTFRSLCGAVRDWEPLLVAAREHGVLGVLAGAIARGGVVVTPAVDQVLQRHMAVARVWHAHQRALVEELAVAFSAAGVPVIALKGPVLAERLYAEGAERHSVDLDLLVSEDAVNTAGAVLTQQGWASAEGPAARYARLHHHHLQFVRPGAPSLELHFRARVGFGRIYPSEALIARARQVPHVTTPLLVLTPEDEYLYLSVHAAAHAFVRLIWLYDLKLLRGRHPALDWAVVVTRARALGVLAAVAFASRMLEERLGVTRPAHPDLDGRGVRQAVARRIQKRVVAGRGLLALDRAGGLAFTSLLSEGPVAASRLWGHHAARSVKRRLQRALPTLVSSDWAG
jgi:hypothetical protein